MSALPPSNADVPRPDAVASTLPTAAHDVCVAPEKSARSAAVADTIEQMRQATTATTPAPQLEAPSHATGATKPSRRARVARVAERALHAAKHVGANAIGALVGVWQWVKQQDRPFDGDGDGDSADAAAMAAAAGAATAADVPPGQAALWELFRWTQDAHDKASFKAWLALNGAQDAAATDATDVSESQAARRLHAMEQVAAEINEMRAEQAPVVLQDYNVPLLHPFAHDDREIFAAYLQQMSRNGTYASGTEARAVAEALDIRIAVYQPVKHADGTQTEEFRQAYGREDAPDVIHIRHDGGAHWTGVLRPRGVPAAEPLGGEDRHLRTSGDGNCLFHAIERSLDATCHPAARKLSHVGLRRLAMGYMRDNADAFIPALRLEVDIARADMRPRYQDQVDALAVNAVRRAHLHMPWDATWEFLADHAEDVKSFNGGSEDNLTSRAMDQLTSSLAHRMEQAIEAGLLTPEAFVQRLGEIASARGKTATHLLEALSPRQRMAFVTVFRPQENLMLEQAETTLGAMFTTLALSDRLRLTGTAALNIIITRELQHPDHRAEFIETLEQELNATRHTIFRARPLTPEQWAAVGADAAVREAAHATLEALAGAESVQPAKLRTLYRLVAMAPDALRDAFLATLLHHEPRVFARLGQALNQRIDGSERRDGVDRAANHAAIDAMFRSIHRR